MGRKEYDELDDDAKKIVDKMVGHPVNDNKEEEEEDADLKPAAVPSIPTSTHHIHHDQAEFPLYTGGTSTIFGAFVAFGAFVPFGAFVAFGAFVPFGAFELFGAFVAFGAFVPFGAFEPFTSRRRSVLRPKFS